MSKTFTKPEKVEKILEGETFNLIPFKEERITASYIGWLNNPEVNQFLEVRFSAQNKETVSAYVRSFQGPEEKYMWGIYAKAGELIGTATLYLINRIHESAEIGLMIGEKAYWGKGASEEAMELICRFGFDQIGLRRLTGGSYAANMGMNFTFKKLGFRCEGKMVQAFMAKDGKYSDGYRWALLAEEWKGRKKS